MFMHFSLRGLAMTQALRNRLATTPAITRFRWLEVAALAFGVAAGGDALGYTNRRPDFNGDGAADLAIGVPAEDNGAGAVNVIYGKEGTGLTSAGNRLWYQGALFTPASSEEGDRFGSALAWADFNDDGYADLAIGIPGEDVGDVLDAGAVIVLYGSEDGLTETGFNWFDQGSPNVADLLGAHERFGAALATGDFDDDGFADLAIGVPGDFFLGVHHGGVNILRGSSQGLIGSGDPLFGYHSPELFMESDFMSSDHFGQALTSGDFDSDGADDLAIGCPHSDADESVDWDDDPATAAVLLDNPDAGNVIVLYGREDEGLSTSRAQRWNQATENVRGQPNPEEQFGFSVAAGDFDCDSYCDLAIGVPNDLIPLEGSGWVKCGSVNVLYGSPDGITSLDILINQTKSFIPGAAEDNDDFGYSLAVGRFDQDAYYDLAIGVPGEDVSRTNVGSVLVMYGSEDGLLAQATEDLYLGNLTPDPFLPAGDFLFPPAGARFGHSLSVGDFDGDVLQDLVVGTPGAFHTGGCVQILPGGDWGLTRSTERWSQAGAISGQVEPGDRFGW